MKVRFDLQVFKLDLPAGVAFLADGDEGGFEDGTNYRAPPFA